jgi:ComF family protein
MDMLGALVSLFYPPTCAECSANVSAGEYLCGKCDASALRIDSPFCRTCSEPFSGAISGPFTCANCADRTLHFETAVSAFRSRGVVRRVIHQFKYGQEVYLRHLVSRWLDTAFDDDRIANRQFDLLVPVPLHSARRRERGFNQAEILAKLIARKRGIPCQPLLKRVRYTTTQTAFDRTERMNNLRDAFVLRKKADVRGLRVLLIDDVLTTGATLSECAHVLRKAGALSVCAATAARA